MMITQTEIAKKCGVSQQFVSKVLAGKNRPSWKTAKRFAAATGTTPELWLEGTPEEMRAALSRLHGRRSGKDRRKNVRRACDCCDRQDDQTLPAA